VPRGLERVASDGWTGVRLPAHRATAALLAELDFPIVLSSANASGDAPLVDADAVLARFGGELDLVLDGGRARLGEASEVVRIGPGRFELLRPGLLPIEDLRRTAGLRIAFVCTGITCRSPMAEALAQALLRRRLTGGADVPITLADFGFEVTSMGVHAGAGSPAAQHAQEVVRARGLDLSEHRSRPAIPERVRAFDRVYCLTASHLEALAHSLPPGAARHVSLLDPRGEDVPDPIGGSVADYERCADLIQRALEQRVSDWA
jgi:protein-tyrosine phosphatase